MNKVTRKVPGGRAVLCQAVERTPRRHNRNMATQPVAPRRLRINTLVILLLRKVSLAHSEHSRSPEKKIIPLLGPLTAVCLDLGKHQTELLSGAAVVPASPGEPCGERNRQLSRDLLEASCWARGGNAVSGHSLGITTKTAKCR